jgi:NAD(P)-dependent dehydrogenase (short-subunit alcohol dehydrogenase family)
MFNNAGIGGGGRPIDTLREDDVDRMIGVLLRGVFFGIKHAARVMKPQGSGSIINTASVAGLMKTISHLPYSTCKAAVIHMTRVAAVELGEHGIRVNCICPA